MKHGIENLHVIHFKLHMMGVSVKGALYIYGDNMSVLTNMSKPESTLMKKSNLICYHAIREERSPYCPYPNKEESCCLVHEDPVWSDSAVSGRSDALGCILQ
jgi:hypothetical protein